MAMSGDGKVIEARIRALLAGQELHVALADVDTVVDDLRRMHREYQRRKVAAMRLQVGKVLERMVRDAPPLRELTDEEEEEEEEAGAVGMGDEVPLPQRGNGMNASLTGMYAAAGTARSGSEKMGGLDGAVDGAVDGAMDGVDSVERGGEHPADAGDGQDGRVAAGATASVDPRAPHHATPTTGLQKKRKVGGQPGGMKKARAGGKLAQSNTATPLPITYADLGGIDNVLEDVRELIEYPLTHPEVYAYLGVSPPRGVLLHGPPGCGKTALANAIANHCQVPFLKISAPEVVSGMSGESEAKVRGLFKEAAQRAPCIMFIDEIDAIATKREGSQRGMEQRIVAQMLTCMDDLNGLSAGEERGHAGVGDGNGVDGVDGVKGGDMRDAGGVSNKHVVVIGATNRPDALDSALRRAGRFDREISMGIPSEASREQILKKMSGKLRLSGDFSFADVAKKTPGFVGADLAALIKEAAALAVKRIFANFQAGPSIEASMATDIETAVAETTGCGSEATAGTRASPVTVPLTLQQMHERNLAITSEDFAAAIGKVQPSVRREGFATTPGVTWSDVGSLGEVREELSFAISRPISNPQLFESMGINVSVGVLLFGPPGCGKTLVAKAVANDSGANFISIKGPELLNKYVGESERAVRQVFSRARAAAPCVLFFDELDALAPRRGSDTSSGPAERVVNQLLTEMDGVDGRQGVYLVAATNRPDIIDPALLRPGRLEKILYVPLPAPDGRSSILQALTRATPLGQDVDLAEIAAMDELTGFSGADLASLVREASVMALKERLDLSMVTDGGDASVERVVVDRRHFVMSLSRVQPSVSRKVQRMYDSLRLKLRSTRGHLRGERDTSQAGGQVGTSDQGNDEPMAVES